MVTILLNKIKENWQLLATALIAWSIFDLYNYYTLFGIEILSYISISEAILLAYPAFLNGLLAILILTILIVSGLRNKKKESDPEKEKLIKYIDEYNDKLFHFKEKIAILKAGVTKFSLRKLPSIIISIIGLIIEVAFWLCIFYIGYEIYRIFKFESLEIYPTTRRLRFGLLLLITIFFLFPIFSLISEFFEKYSHRVFSILTITRSPILYFITGFIINGLISNRLQYLSIANGKSNVEISFLKDNSKIETGDKLVYIGSTKDFIFLRNITDTSSSAIYKNQVSNLSIKKNKP